MKKLLISIICLALVLLLAGCGSTHENAPGEASESSEHTDEALTEYRADSSYVYHAKTAYAGYTESAEAFGCLNSDLLSMDSVMHLPVYKIDTKDELDAFKESKKDVFVFDCGYDEVPSFDEAGNYDESFFETKCLVICYVPSSSGSFRYNVTDVFCDGEYFTLYVEKTNDPEAYTCDMSGWFMLVEAEKTNVDSCSYFDAQMK